MSLMVEAWILDRYGPRLTVGDAAKVLGLSEGTLRNKIGKPGFMLKTYFDSGRWVAACDLASYLDQVRSQDAAE